MAKEFDQLDDLLESAAEQAPIVIKSGLLHAAEHATSELRRTIYERFQGRTGNLARSFNPEFVGLKNRVWTAQAVSRLAYAKIQDEGGTVRPRTTRSLAVPLKQLPVGKWPRHFGQGELTLIRNPKTGKVLLAKVTGKGENTRYDWHYVLKKEVRITGKQYVKDAKDRAMPGIRNILRGSLAEIRLGGDT